MRNLEKLLSISESFGNSLSEQISSSEMEKLGLLYKDANGLISFEGALICFPLTSGSELTIRDWNTNSKWKKHYSAKVQNTMFFSYDIFGHSYGVLDTEFVKLNPEDGSLERKASSLEEWCKIILDDYSYETGWQLAHDWQLANRPLKKCERLLPKIPFSLGGHFEIENLSVVDNKRVMGLYSNFYDQVKNAVEGQQLSINGWL